jgi:hypothetical protein
MSPCPFVCNGVNAIAYSTSFEEATIYFPTVQTRATTWTASYEINRITSKSRVSPGRFKKFPLILPTSERRVPVDPDRLEMYLVLVEELHFTRAAQRLDMSEPSFSRQIGKLEASLHVKLAIRTTRTVRLTDAGVVFAAAAMRRLAEIRYTKARIAAIDCLP